MRSAFMCLVLFAICQAIIGCDGQSGPLGSGETSTEEDQPSDTPADSPQPGDLPSDQPVEPETPIVDPIEETPSEPVDAGVVVDPGRFDVSTDLFPQGVASAEATSTSIRLWTRYSGRAPIEALVFRVGTDGSTVLACRVESLEANSEGIVQFDVEELIAGTAYQYFFLERWNAASGVRSRLGRFRTAPDPEELVPVTFAASGDTKGSMAPYPIMGQLADEEVEFFIHLGDTAICDPAERLDEYRLKYREVWADSNHIEARAAMGFYAIWDDHEVANNWAGEDYVGTDQFEAAFRAFVEYNPIRLDEGHPTRLWRAFRWGRTLDLIILDCRSERFGDQYISTDQMEWLKQRLIDPTTTFKIIVNSVPIGNYTSIRQEDRWQGYDAQRDEILQFIHDQQIENVYWISSDFHAVIMAELTDPDWCESPENRACPFVGYDFVVGPFAQTLFNVWIAAEVLSWVEFVRACDYTYHVFTADPTTDPPELRVRVMAEQGEPDCVIGSGDDNVLYENTFRWRN